MFPSVITTSVLFLPLVAGAAIQKRGITGPVITSNFPDPSFVKGLDGTWYAFSTNSGGKHVPVANSPDFITWTLTGADALPTVGAWSTGGDVWAPDVIQRPDGKFVMYYSADQNGNGGKHCIGAAVSDTAHGPYTPEPTALSCNTAQGGAIDPAGFVDTDGTVWVVWKIDGNSIGHGGNCNNGVPPIVSTPIMLQQLAADGITPIGSPVQILDRSDADGPLVEAPSLVKVNGVYILFFSSNCYSGGLYDTSYATADNIKGPYTKAQAPNAPLLQTGTPYSQLYSPGGLDVGPGGVNVLFHADKGTTADVRQLYAGQIKVTGKTVHFT
uniref:Putative beta-xylosidase n=1 Tax=Phanerodontia chrysosporium TaxID=2822231 RepID=K7TM35_PHACH|nr:putative beta-xylosidase [Phanerodontia chrysosporium]